MVKIASRIVAPAAMFVITSYSIHYTKLYEQEQLRDDIPVFGIGDTVKVNVKVVEGTRET